MQVLENTAIEARRQALEIALLEGEPFWRDMPFRVARPGWVDAYPDLDHALAHLSEGELTHLLGDNRALIEWLSARVQSCRLEAALIDVPRQPVGAHRPDCRHVWGIPGRKLEQIEAFLDAIDTGAHEVLEWCSGKGHLGRLLSLRCGSSVTSLELQADLCADGEWLAQRAGATRQQFIAADAFAPDSAALVAGRQAVALHACGDLHRTLVSNAIAHGGQGLHVAPCCYYQLGSASFTPNAAGSRLRLSRDDLRLAVTETVTAPAREIRTRDREAAWKLAFVAWREMSEGAPYKTFKPLPEAWLRLPFAAFMTQVCAREGIHAPSGKVLTELEARGWERQRVMMRRSVVRLAYRRILELWLVCDLAVPLLHTGYRVAIREFCARKLTPRNLLLSAVR
ncbi:methyltransferase [Niveibacterium umoris]|uniref:Methyltransferase domain-containing protein n=1 Tax=Niveibacterium umoris TaxID=1193620 RepID=A0A840BFQ6_9RHOO|nr:methyltransferase [Niveibacterium umoris]MBB4011024.1 hypothetical protein [Niveibacterium umoris]